MGANSHVHKQPSLHLCLLRAPLEGAGRNHPFSLCLHSQWAGLGGVEILCKGWGSLRTLSLCLAHSLWAPLITHLGFSLLKEFLGKIKDPFHPQLLPE